MTVTVLLLISNYLLNTIIVLVFIGGCYLVYKSFRKQRNSIIGAINNFDLKFSVDPNLSSEETLAQYNLILNRADLSELERRMATEMKEVAEFEIKHNLSYRTSPTLSVTDFTQIKYLLSLSNLSGRERELAEYLYRKLHRNIYPGKPISKL